MRGVTSLRTPVSACASRTGFAAGFAAAGFFAAGSLATGLSFGAAGTAPGETIAISPGATSIAPRARGRRSSEASQIGKESGRERGCPDVVHRVVRVVVK